MTKLNTIAFVAIGVVSMVVVTNPAFADKCEAGIDVTLGNNHTYCVSNTHMHWWAAFSWCEAQGRHLASWEEVCSEARGTNKCSNLLALRNNSDFWAGIENNATYQAGNPFSGTHVNLQAWLATIAPNGWAPYTISVTSSSHSAGATGSSPSWYTLRAICW